ncbi:GNAT family N-acetyltransferase [Phenylobacterium montanum]|uniref:GNAT family N-acetyltransferase n=1 Tax=Phenylobacterium montanum TaxID=2823693 RepID=A0A975G3T8_9CAUL|nr:GNAT family N-acetyltransferase [Caulobacter sp. S6]QUD90156.1 GNAT family N-acetyltransferase [Caulobacter sp. S6]
MTYAIVPATEDLIAEIEVWLDAEDAVYEVAEAAWAEAPFDSPKPTRGFRCNWNTVKKTWREDGVPLDVLVKEGATVGFLWGTDIVEIHPDHRGRSLGVMLSDHMLRRVSEEGFCILEIQIAPHTAEPFWLRQGFALLDDDIHFRNGLYAFKVIPRDLPLGAGPKVPVQIMFHDEQTVHLGGEPFSTFEGEGERLPDGSIQLPERVHGYSPLLRENTDNHIRIVVDGEEIYFGRSKYGQAHGTKRDPAGNHYIDRVLPG